MSWLEGLLNYQEVERVCVQIWRAKEALSTTRTDGASHKGKTSDKRNPIESDNTNKFQRADCF